MAFCELRFSNWDNPELYRVSFRAPGSNETIVAVRGKSARGHLATASFQWTTAVQALAVLMVRKTYSSGQIELDGERTSFASSLDYALGRCPQWLTEMFGCGESKKPRSRRLFIRKNPDGRNGGPILVSLNDALWKEIPIRIFVNTTSVSEPSELERLAQLLESSTIKSNLSQADATEAELSTTKPPIVEMPPPYRLIRDALRQPFEDALIHGLCTADVLHPAGFNRYIRRIGTCKSFQRVAGSRRSDINEVALPSDQDSRLAFGQALQSSIDFLREREPLNVLCPVSLIGSVSMFYFLRDYCRIPFNLKCEYPHAVSIASNFANKNFLGNPDLVALGVGPSAYVLGSDKTRSYVPLFPLPCMSARVFTAQGKESKLEKRHRYVLLSDEPSNPLFLYEDLRDAGLTKNKPVHAETDETFARLKEDPTLRAIIFFPYDILNIKFNNCREVEIPDNSYKPDLLLFGRNEIARNAKLRFALGTVLRHAWLELLANTSARRGVIEKILNDEHYLQIVFRASGMYQNIYKAAA